jgi:hypothetical protein
MKSMGRCEGFVPKLSLFFCDVLPELYLIKADNSFENYHYIIVMLSLKINVSSSVVQLLYPLMSLITHTLRTLITD